MTNLLVLSDSHGNKNKIREAIERQALLPARERPDYIVFLGDGVRDLAALSDHELATSVLAVKGNCDAFGAEATPKLLHPAFSNFRAVMMHGDAFSVKNGLENAVRYAVDQGADLLLFGHTHRPYFARLEAGMTAYGILLKKPLVVFNPGSIQQGSFGLISLSEQGIVVSHGSI